MAGHDTILLTKLGLKEVCAWPTTFWTRACIFNRNQDHSPRKKTDLIFAKNARIGIEQVIQQNTVLIDSIRTLMFHQQILTRDDQ